MEKLRSLTGLVVCFCLVWAAPARADVVGDWNAITLLYVGGGPGTPPNPPAGRAGPPGLLDIALVHLAIHDAVQAIEGRFQPYESSTPGSGSVEAAAAAAAHRVLVLLYPGPAGTAGDSLQQLPDEPRARWKCRAGSRRGRSSRAALESLSAR